MTTAREETTRLAELLRREHHAMADFLLALARFDAERRWEALGHRSLFEFLTRELKLSAGAAQYRKTACELVRRYPEVEAALRDGRLCLSSVIEVAKVVTAANVAAVLPRFFGKSSRDAAFIAASLRPAGHPPVRTFLVTPVRATPSAPAPPFGAEPGGDGLLRAPEVALAAPVPDAALLPVSPPPAPERPRVRPLDAERARVNMTVSRRLLEKLAAARDALSHSHPGATEETILELGLDLIIDRHRKRRGIGAKERAAKVRTPSTATATPTPIAQVVPAAPPPPAAARSRHVPAEVWRAVWERDGGRCVWPLEGGGVCGSTHRLQLDHVDGWALGGETTVARCRLLCDRHNDLHAVQAGTWVTFWTGHIGDTCLELPRGGRGQSPGDGSSSLRC